MTAFISGQITNRIDTYQYAFADAQMVLEFLGYKVLNPAWLPKGLKIEDYVKIDNAMLECADVIVLLPGWETSEGARKEVELAKKLGKQIQTYGRVKDLDKKEGVMKDGEV
jgi:hypothetical protein